MLAVGQSDALDILMFGVPMFAALIFGCFHLDKLFGSKTPLPRPHHPLPSIHSNGDSACTDPDGKHWDETAG